MKDWRSQAGSSIEHNSGFNPKLLAYFAISNKNMVVNVRDAAEIRLAASTGLREASA
jgi:hypothetical protein